MLDHSLGRVDTLEGLMRYHYCELQDKHAFVKVEPSWEQGIVYDWVRCERCGLLAVLPPVHVNCRCMMVFEEGG